MLLYNNIGEDGIDQLNRRTPREYHIGQVQGAQQQKWAAGSRQQARRAGRRQQAVADMICASAITIKTPDNSWRGGIRRGTIVHLHLLIAAKRKEKVAKKRKEAKKRRGFCS